MDIKKIVKTPFRTVKRICNYVYVETAYKKASYHYEQVISEIKKEKKQRLKFAAFVVFDSCYAIEELFSRMQKSEKWDPKIVIIPDVFRGEEHKREAYEHTKEFFEKKYGEDIIIDGWNSCTNEFYDLVDNFDMVYFANPYDTMVHKYHSIEYASTKNVLPFYVSYGYDICTATTQGRFKNIALNVVWKCFTDTTLSYADFKKYMINKGRNVSLVGYSKMDSLNNCTLKKHSRKKILISPHHTIKMKELPLSNFLTYYKLILELPKMFANIDFVFRPHPLLFTNLVNQAGWTSKDVNDYLEALEESGVEYSYGGDYFELFSDCDAIINDCGSYTVEWLYTGKPGCFVYNPSLKPELLTNLMNQCIEQYTIARSETDIINFIKSIESNESNGNYAVSSWVKDNIMINYPDVTRKIMEEIEII